MLHFFLRTFIVICSVGTLAAVAKLIVDARNVRALRSELNQLISAEPFRLTGTLLRLTRENWAQFERTVHNLRQVIVVADIVQEPHNELREAVIHNFSRGVQYKFVVSRSKAVAEKNGYLKIFEQLAEIAIEKHRLQLSVEDLVTIESFEDEWNGVPFVFYRVEDTDAPITAPTRFRTIAFWGDKWRVGIADNYESLAPPVADALATALMAGAPQPVKKMLEKLEQDKFPQAAEILEANSTQRFRVVREG